MAWKKFKKIKQNCLILVLILNKKIFKKATIVLVMNRQTQHDWSTGDLTPIGNRNDNLSSQYMISNLKKTYANLQIDNLITFLLEM